MRERLKHACWKLLHAGYTVRVQSTLAYHIEMCGDAISFRYFERSTALHQLQDGTVVHLPTCQEFRVPPARKGFGSAFDTYFLGDPGARLHRGPRRNMDPRIPFVPKRKVESEFARCAHVMHCTLWMKKGGCRRVAIPLQPHGAPI